MKMCLKYKVSDIACAELHKLDKGGIQGKNKSKMSFQLSFECCKGFCIPDERRSFHQQGTVNV